MSYQILTALIGVVAALAGTAIGGLTTYYSNRNLKMKEWHLSVLKDEIDERQKLYSDFLAEASRLMLISVGEKCSDLKEFHLLGNLAAQIELLGSPGVVEASKAIFDNVLNCHCQNDKEQAPFFDVKTGFIAKVKEELQNMKKME